MTVYRRKQTSLKKTKGRALSSARWLARQRRDPYTQKARQDGYRARSAYKLLEIYKRCDFMRGIPPGTLLDLGAAPGAWSQVLSRMLDQATKKKHAIIALDLLPMQPLEGVDFMQGDFLDDTTREALQERGPYVGIFSDMAPNTSGISSVDGIRSMILCQQALAFAVESLLVGGFFLVKIFQEGLEGESQALCKRCFREVRAIKPPASRKESREMYLLAQGFRGDIPRE